MRSGLVAACNELRAFVQGVMPALLIERGLYAATEDLVDRMPVPTRLECHDRDRSLPAGVQQTAYFVVAEALTTGSSTLAPRSSRSAWRVTTDIFGSRSQTWGRRCRPGSGTGLADSPTALMRSAASLLSSARPARAR